MKSFAILGFLIAAGFIQAEYYTGNSPLQLDEDASEVVTGCKILIEKERYDDILKDLGNIGEPIPERIFIANELVGCVWNTMGFILLGKMDDHYLVPYIAAYHQISKKNASKIVGKCENIRGNDYSEAARNIMTCLAPHLKSNSKAIGHEIFNLNFYYQ